VRFASRINAKFKGGSERTLCVELIWLYGIPLFLAVPRKVLKEKYQGEPEPDELFEDEHEEEGTDPVLEQPSIYSPDHSKGTIWASSRPKTTPKPPLQTSLNQIPGKTRQGSSKSRKHTHTASLNK